MKKVILLLAAVLTLGAAASNAVATSTATYQAKLGDRFPIAGTTLVCSVSLLHGKPGAACAKVSAGHIVAGTYNIAISDEYAAIGQSKNGNNEPAAVKQQPSLGGSGFGSTGNGGSSHTLHSGDQVKVLGSHVLFEVGKNKTGVVFVSAVPTTPSVELIPGSYGVGISSVAASLSQVKSKSGDQTIVVTKKNP